MNIHESKKKEMIRFYLDIAAENQRVSNRISGRVVREFKPKRDIRELKNMLMNNRTSSFPTKADKPKKHTGLHFTFFKPVPRLYRIKTEYI